MSRDHKQFIKQFLKSPKKTGAIAPSSNHLARLITETANLKQKSCVVELGPGTGVFTREIHNQVSSDTVFFSLEVNPEFVVATRAICPKAIVYQASAEQIKHYLNKHQQSSCDCIISGLPWAAFDQQLQNKLLTEIVDSLTAGGNFLTFAYLQGLLLPAGIRFKKLLEKKFTTVSRTKVVWRNIPPALVYHCIK